MIEDLEAEFPELSRLRVPRPRVSREPILWAFLSALGAGFIANGIGEIAQAALWPVIVPPTQPHPEWLTPFAVVRAAQLVAVGAIALRAGGIVAFALCVGYEAALVIAQLPNRIALCERVDPRDPAFGIPCGFGPIAASTWPTWLALFVGLIGSRWLLPSSMPGANTLLRAAGAFTLTLSLTFNAWMLGQTALMSGLAIVGWVDAQGSRSPSFLVAISTVFLVIELIAGLLAGVMLRRARPAAVLLLALLFGYGISFGLTLIRSNVDQGVPHPPDLAYLQSGSVLVPAAGILGIAIGRLLAQRLSRNRVVPAM